MILDPLAPLVEPRGPGLRPETSERAPRAAIAARRSGDERLALADSTNDPRNRAPRLPQAAPGSSDDRARPMSRSALARPQAAPHGALDLRRDERPVTASQPVERFHARIDVAQVRERPRDPAQALVLRRIARAERVPQQTHDGPRLLDARARLVDRPRVDPRARQLGERRIDLVPHDPLQLSRDRTRARQTKRHAATLPRPEAATAVPWTSPVGRSEAR